MRPAPTTLGRRSAREADCRLIHLADFAAPYSGSFLPMVLATTVAAKRRGWAAEIVLPGRAQGRDWLGALSAAGVSYTFIAPATSRRRWLGWLLDEATQGRRPDPLARAIDASFGGCPSPTILHTHFSAYDVAAAQVARRRNNVAVLWHEHSLRRPGLLAKGGGLTKYRLLGRNVDRFLCVAPDVAESIAGLADHERTVFVPNAIDVARFPLPTDAARAHARAELGIDTNAAVLLHFGWDWARKGGDEFLATVSMLAGECGSGGVVGLTVGRDAARTAVAESGLGALIRVVDPAEEVQLLYAAADVLLSIGRSEGMPFGVLEALASGLPVVASVVKGHSFISERASACVLTDRRPEALTRATRDLLRRDGGLRATERAEARRWVVEEMSLSAWTSTVMGIYEDVLQHD